MMGYRDVWKVLQTAWKLYQKYADSDLDEKALESLLANVDHLWQSSSQQPFEKAILTAVVCELAQIAKVKEREK